MAPLGSLLTVFGVARREMAGRASGSPGHRPLKSTAKGAEIAVVTNAAAKTLLDPARETAIVGNLYERVMEHLPAQYERQAGRCAGCGNVLPTVADGLLRLDGDLECIDCNLRDHHPFG